MFNKIIIVGTLVDNPSTKRTKRDKPITTIIVKTRHEFVSNGEIGEHFEEHRVVLFDRLATIAVDRLSKGDLCLVMGRSQTKEWNVQGELRVENEIIGEDLIVLSDYM